MMKKIDKTVSRDLPLINVYAWHRGYTVGMKKWLGWSYSDAIFYLHDGFVDIMRPPTEHLIDYKKAVVAKMKNDKKWFVSVNNNFHLLVDEINGFYRKNINNINTCSPAELLAIYSQYVDYVEKIMGSFISMVWFPIWSESDERLKKTFSNEIEEMVKNRLMSEQIFPEGDILINKILKKIQPKLGLNDLDIRLLSKEEFNAFLIKEKLPNKEKIRAREKGILYCNKGIISAGNKIQEIENAFASIGFDYKIKDYSNTTEIKGVAACKGKVKGKVMVIMSKAKIAEMKDGFVLVASMTTPEYAPAIKKSIAFITDEGGMTCHAAIVARELKKPCIIGTKIATKVLKDGDLVEVDAERGTVKILQRKKKEN